MLHIEPVALVVVDALVSVCSLLSDSTDDRPWQERLEVAFGELRVDEISSGLADLATGEAQEAVIAWADRVRKVGYRAFARRLLGQAEYDRLEQALREDAAIVALAVRRGVRAAMPFVVAWEDALTVMSREQLQAVTSIDLVAANMGQFLHDLDNLLGSKVLPALPMEVATIRENEFLDCGPLTEIARATLSASTLAQLARVNECLVRKLNGARDALDHSADGVAQAASSLIELIDRVLREAVDHDTVLGWIDRELPDQSNLTFLNKAGDRVPTKQGEILCFLYASGSVARPPTDADDGTGPLLFYQVLASAIVASRTKLQRLKHADDAGDSDRAALEGLLSAVEEALMVALTIQQLVSGAHNRELSESA